MEPSQNQAMALPTGIATFAQLSKVISEMESVDDFFRQSSVRKTGNSTVLPKVSQLFEELVETNKLNLLQQDHRDYLLQSLVWLRENAPQVHMSFSAEPSPQFISKLTVWYRQNVSPFMLIRVGLQPTIGVGCILRTTNKIFDFSLRKRFAGQKQKLIDELAGSTRPEVAEVTA
jgi:F0F1-type ATP synthase delta subunit